MVERAACFVVRLAPGGRRKRTPIGIVVVVPTMPSARVKVPRGKGGGRRWTSFIAGDASTGKRIRGLHDERNPRHQLRVEHGASTLLIDLSEEDGVAWTTFAVDRATRQCSVAQADRQSDSGAGAYDGLYEQLLLPISPIRKRSVPWIGPPAETGRTSSCDQRPSSPGSVSCLPGCQGAPSRDLCLYGRRVTWFSIKVGGRMGTLCPVDPRDQHGARLGDFIAARHVMQQLKQSEENGTVV